MAMKMKRVPIRRLYLICGLYRQKRKKKKTEILLAVLAHEMEIVIFSSAAPQILYQFMNVASTK